MENIHYNKSVNVMVSPQFYTLKKEALPVKYAYQAKKIAPALFDGLLEEASEYDFFVQKQNDEWILIAYNTTSILDFLKSKGFLIENISKLYFAQQSISMFNRPLALGEHNALVAIEETMVVLPKVVLEDEPSLYFTDLFTPKQSITIKTTSSSTLFSLNDTLILSTIFTLFGILFILEGLSYGVDKAEQSRFDDLIASHSYLQSSYKRKSIIQKYKKLDKSEREKRDIIKELSTMIFKGVKLSHFSLNNKKIEASFICINQSVSLKLKELAIKKHFKVMNITGSNDLVLRKSL